MSGRSRIGSEDGKSRAVRGSSKEKSIDEWDVPFEFVGKFSCTSTVAKAGDIESSAAARHYGSLIVQTGEAEMAEAQHDQVRTPK